MGILFTIATQAKQNLSTICKSCGTYESSNRTQCAGCAIEQQRQREVTREQKQKFYSALVHSVKRS